MSINFAGCIDYVRLV